MKSKIGIALMVIGAMLTIGALFLFIHNEKEAETAGSAAEEVMPELLVQMQDNKIKESIAAENVSEHADGEEPTKEGILTPGTPAELLTPEEVAMDVVEIKGVDYIGYLSMPTLGLELPVASEWSYRKLTKSPCRYSGTVLGEDMVVMAHNYARHFGRLSKLVEGDTVRFTDVNGTLYEYEVAARDVLTPADVEEMTAGVYDLALFTCNYSGSKRVTVFCDLR